MKTPLIIINFKTYKEATGERALKLARVCEKVALSTRTSIVVAVQYADILRIAQKVKIPVISQHIDNISFGRDTGHVLPEAVKQAGAMGTLLNHSEMPLEMDVLKDTIEKAKKLRLKTIVCCSRPELCKSIALFKPDFIAIEPPELIAGDVSVSMAKPELITKAVNSTSIPVLCGAGIKNRDDVRKAIELGAKGILLASGITKADNPETVLRDLVKGLK